MSRSEAIVAPSGYATDEAAVQRGIGRLESLGCRVFNYYDSAARCHRFGGSDDRFGGTALRIASLDAGRTRRNLDRSLLICIERCTHLAELICAIADRRCPAATDDQRAREPCNAPEAHWPIGRIAAPGGRIRAV